MTTVCARRIAVIASVLLGVLSLDVRAQPSPLTLLEPALQSNGSSLEAVFERGTGQLQQEINDQIYRSQPANVRVTWPLVEIVGVPSPLESSGTRSSVVQSTVRIPNDGFRTSVKQRTVRQWIGGGSGQDFNTDPIEKAVRDGTLSPTTATRLIYNRYAVHQLLMADGAQMSYVAQYGSTSRQGQAIPDRQVEWVFRLTKPPSLPRTLDYGLVTVDVVTDSLTVPLLRSGDGVEFLSQVRVEASLKTTNQFETLSVEGASRQLDNPDAKAGGGHEYPLVVELASRRMGENFRQAREKEDVSQEVGLGVIATVDDSPNQSSFAGLTVGFPKAFGLEGILHPGVTAGLNNQTDVFLGGGFTVGSTLNLSGGWRINDTEEGGQNDAAITASVNLNTLLDRATEDLPPIDVEANENVLSRTAADRNILDASLSVITVEIINQEGEVPDSIQQAGAVSVTADPRQGTQGNVDVGNLEGSGTGIQPVLAGTYESPRLFVELPSGEPYREELQGISGIEILKGEVRTLKIVWDGRRENPPTAEFVDQ